MKTPTNDPIRPEVKLETPPLPERKGEVAWLLGVALMTFVVGAAVLYCCRVPMAR